MRPPERAADDCHPEMVSPILVVTAMIPVVVVVMFGVMTPVVVGVMLMMIVEKVADKVAAMIAMIAMIAMSVEKAYDGHRRHLR